MNDSSVMFQNVPPTKMTLRQFPDVCAYIRGITYNKAQEVIEPVGENISVLRANNITLSKNALNFDEVKYVTSDVKVKHTQWLKAGDILMCASSGSQEHVGKVAYIENDLDYTFGGFMAVIRCSEEVYSRYMFYILSSSWFSKHLKNTLKSNTIKTINADVMNNFCFPVPPLDVQERIVSILDEYSYKNSLLIDALENELSGRKMQYEYYREQLFSPKEGWERTSLLESLTQAVTDGPHETPKLVEQGIPFISAEALSDNRINFDLKRGFITEEYDEICCKKYKPMRGDIYMCKSGSTTGKVAMVETDERFNIWSPLAAIRVDQSKVLPRFMFFQLQTTFIQKQVKAKASKGSQPNLSMRKLEQFEIAYPDLNAQENIVSLMDKYSAVQSQHIEGLKREIALRQIQYEYYRDKLLALAE